MNSKKKHSKFKRLVITTGALLLLAGAPIVQNNPMGAYLNTMTGAITAQAAETAPAFSQYWFQENGQWRIQDGSGNIIKGAWVCDDAVPSNGQEVWYLIDGNGYMISAGLVQDNTGNMYSLETSHSGYYGMLRHVSGNYDGINLSLEASHSGSFAKILNADGIQALAAKYGVTNFPIDNSNCVYTSQFNTSYSGGGSSTTPSKSTNIDSDGNKTQTKGSYYDGMTVDRSDPDQVEWDLDGDGKLSGREYEFYKSIKDMEGVKQGDLTAGGNISF